SLQGKRAVSSDTLSLYAAPSDVEGGSIGELTSDPVSITGYATDANGMVWAYITTNSSKGFVQGDGIIVKDSQKFDAYIANIIEKVESKAQRKIKRRETVLAAMSDIESNG